jgi:ABC-type multidrug transport system ATPase subunit
MLQKTIAPGFLKIKELLDLICRLYPNPYSVQDLLKRGNLEHKQEDWANSDTLSGGEERSLYFSLASAGNPDLLILDEPTTGLSDEATARVLQQIREFVNAGKTILLVSHIKSNVEVLKPLITRTLTLECGRIQETGNQPLEQLPQNQTAVPQPQVVGAANLLSMLGGQTKVELLKLIRQPVFVVSMVVRDLNLNGTNF